MKVDGELVKLLTPDERAELAELLSRYEPPVWEPDEDNGPQCMAYESTADVIGFGGAAGGGKTDLAVGLALTRHKRVQFFRREGTEIGAIVDRVAEVLGNRDGLGGKPPVWRNPTKTCEIVEFCSCPNLGDEAKYQGRPKDLLVIDEASNFLEQQVRFLMGWVRSTEVGQRLLTLLTFNPPTNAEGRWVIEFFAPWLDKKHPNPAKPGELRWFAMVDGKEREVGPDPFEHNGQIIKPRSRTFIPSRVTDNKYLARTDYMAQLESLPEPLRSQMRYGDFHAGTEDDPYQVIPTAWVEAAMARWKRPDQLPPMDSMGIDVAMGGKDNTVIARRHKAWFDELIVRTGVESRDGPTIAGWCASAVRDRAPMHFDVFGVGAEPYAHTMSMGLQVIGVSFGETTTEGIAAAGRMGFFNVRSMAWWRMREFLDPNANTGAALPPDKRLLADLCAPRWKPSGAKIKVESREEIVDRIGRSPDFGTAAILALMDTRKWDEDHRTALPRYHDEFGFGG